MSKLEQYAGRGTENIQDVKTPYLKIAQDISDERKKAKEAFIEGLETGEFFCSTTKRIYGTALDVVVLATDKSYMISEPRTFKFKGTQRNYDPEWVRDPSGKLRTVQGDDVILCYNYLVVPVVNLQEEPDNIEAHAMVLTLKKSDVPAARDWNTMIKGAKLPNGAVPPLFGVVWTLKSQYREDGSKSWYGLCDGKKASIFFKGFLDEVCGEELIDPIFALYEKTEKARLTASQSGNQRQLPSAHVDEDDAEEADGDPEEKY